MFPMERSRIFKILTEIFRDTKREDDDVVPYVMKEDAAITHDINFVRTRQDNTHLNGYRDIDYWLRIIDPRDDCPEYNLVLHSAISDKDANITIDGTGNFRVYGDYINSFVYTTIKNNIQKFCDYAVELTELESRQAFEHVVAIINTYTNELMDIHAGEFVQRDVISRDDCTNFVLKKTPYLWNALGVDVLRNFHKECVPSNDVWVRFDFGNSCCTPIQIYPFRHEVKLEGGQLEKLTGGVITMAECVRIAERIAKDLEYFVTTDSGNTWVKKAVNDFNTTHKLCDEPGAIIDSIVEKVVVITQDWIEIMMHQGVFHSYVCDCGDNLFTLSNNRRVRIRYLTDEIRVQIDGETVIKVTTRDKNWQVFLVLTIDHILKDNKPFTLHQITCLADMIREKLGIEHLYLNDTDRILEKTSEGSYTVTASDGKGIREFFCGVRTPKPNAPGKVIEEHVGKSQEEIGCDEVFQVVVDWLHAMSSCDRIKDVRHILYTHHTLSVSNSVGCGASKQYVTEELEVSYTPYMKSIMISLGKEHIITIDYLGLGDKSTCVYIMKYNQKGIDDVLNKYLVACLAEVLKDRLGMDKLRAYTTVKCTQYTELTHNGPCFFNDDGMTAYVIDPNNVISNETINKNNKPNTILEQMQEIVDKKIRKFVESRSMLYTSKDYLTDQIFSQLKNDWQKDVYLSVYSAVWCTLMESRFKSAAFELEKHFMEYVTLDHDDCFTVIFGLQKIDDNLPGIEINFYSKTSVTNEEIFVRMLDHKASGSGTWSRPLIRLRPSYESIVYFDKIKNTNCTYKSFLANVVSKIVLLEGLS